MMERHRRWISSRAASAGLAVLLCLFAALLSAAGFVTHQAGERVARSTVLHEAFDHARFDLSTSMARVHEYIATRNPKARVAFEAATTGIVERLEGVQYDGRPDVSAAVAELLGVHADFVASAERAFAAIDAGAAPDVEIHARIETDPHLARLRASMATWVELQEAEVTSSIAELNRITQVLWMGTPVIFLLGLAMLYRVWIRIGAQRWALRERERSLRALVGSLDDIVFEFDGQGTYINVWTGDESLLARPRAELLGRRITDVLGEEVGRVYTDAIQRVLQSGRSEAIEYVLDVGAGRRWFLASMNPVRWSDGSHRTVSMVSRDITQRKQAEAERERLLASEQAALAELRATQQQVIQQERLRALGQMASGVAHDFNNALAPIVAYTDLLLMAPGKLDDQAQVRSFLEMIQTAAEDATGVVRRLREFYRQREGDEAVDPVQLGDLIAQVISLTQFRWKDQAQARGSSITVKTDVEPGPPVAGNAADLREALTNLIFNAVDGMPGGGTITISTRTVGDAAVLAISDTGVGMTDEVRLRCLEPFFTTKGDHGTGLGLGLVYGIVQRHQGTLEIESAPGAGTTVSLRLPLWSRGTPEASEPLAAHATRPLRVLVVEDEPLIRRALVEYLRVDGHTVETASDGRDALAQFRVGAFDLVLTDRALPEMSGDQVAAAVKQVAPDVPVVMLTGFGDLMSQHGERPDGIDVVVSKPVTLTGLRNAIAQVTGS